MSEKVEMITVYVENKGKGKMSIADSLLSVQEFPNKKEGEQAVGIFATKTKLPKDHLKALVGVLDAHYPHQANVLSEKEYKDFKKGKAAPPKAQNTGPSAEEQEEKLYKAAMSGGDDEILAYLEAYQNGPHAGEVQERVVYLDAKAKNTKKAYSDFLKKYPKGPYSEEIKTILSQG
ncbi:hypothetical protein KAR91_55735 [Candidatus Pacearchaeota archaeon]|nr:hypothetical protein [Candidatus Pacearchaeota archaeon]